MSSTLADYFYSFYRSLSLSLSVSLSLSLRSCSSLLAFGHHLIFFSLILGFSNSYVAFVVLSGIGHQSETKKTKQNKQTNISFPSIIVNEPNRRALLWFGSDRIRHNFPRASINSLFVFFFIFVEYLFSSTSNAARFIGRPVNFFFARIYRASISFDVIQSCVYQPYNNTEMKVDSRPHLFLLLFQKKNKCRRIIMCVWNGEFDWFLKGQRCR